MLCWFIMTNSEFIFPFPKPGFNSIIHMWKLWRLFQNLAVLIFFFITVLFLNISKLFAYLARIIAWILKGIGIMDVVELTVSFNFILPSQGPGNSGLIIMLWRKPFYIYWLFFLFSFCLFSAICIIICLKGPSRRSDKIYNQTCWLK